ncbi:MAG: ATP-binding protein [Comamonadaceae bacterium]|jgi:SpoVK/Ycf46/Vps4 family AAA+-type ATPase|nr:ATP-binding protein [Comamonadaceae bacterium]
MPKVSPIAARLENLAAPLEHESQLRAIAAARVGTVLITGASGTERARTAQALARLAGGALMRVDLSQVVSRYIGETEKNLDRLLTAAAASGSVLFFDEADALLGRRSGVKDSHDRYANIEVSHLLQRVESYGGWVVLATSGRQNLDAAFLRRLRHVVDLPGPPDGG